ncbi:allantoinase AllB [Fretibacterium sp. OH1220_COT-178]|uniref:allantoinase AllB n=1 Tax=Fretibacterium sp. OH1220_COT-178 TaxID=2491047 RepID=UPI000F5DD3AB|nr:allantoinase AllB [Fretibacterium sp. OH1220_COT-178]RRD65416.1 allantoinase AllB [Fretibacterium sp. OH1220_COT-178]
MNTSLFSCTITNGLVATPSGVVEADIGIADGKIAALAARGMLGGGERVLDAAGKLVLPAVVDAHVHFNDPGLPEREDMATGTAAAAAGGVGTVVDMPLSGAPAVTSVETLELKKRAAAERAVVDYALWGGLVDDNVSELRAMRDAGAIAFKAFTCFAGNDFPYARPEVLYRGLIEAKRSDLLVGVHCEDEGLTSSLERRAREEGRSGARDFLDAHAPVTELLAVDALLEMARSTGARVHICHATLPEVIDRASRARGEARVTVETCPHYLIFSDADLDRLKGVLKCTPPVRSRESIEGLWERVLNGSVDVISSDHSPSTAAQKNPASGSFWDMWGGVQGVQTMLPALFTHGVKRRGMSVEALVRLVCENPARLMGLYPRKGAVRIGSDADLTILDPDARWTLAPEMLLHKNKHSPYIGMEFEGRVTATLVRGAVVFDGEKITASPGTGRLLS